MGLASLSWLSRATPGSLVTLVQGPRMVRDVFRLAKENAPAIIFIDEIDAIATARFDAQTGADREVQRILMELLNQVSLQRNTSRNGTVVPAPPSPCFHLYFHPSAFLHPLLVDNPPRDASCLPSPCRWVPSRL